MNPILDDPRKYGFNADNLCISKPDCIWNNDFHIVPEAHNQMAMAMLEPLKNVGF